MHNGATKILDMYNKRYKKLRLRSAEGRIERANKNMKKNGDVQVTACQLHCLQLITQ